MVVAWEWLKGEGWVVVDRSATESYDLLAKRGAEVLYVEVKGTTGEGDSIQLTRLEVEFAQAHRDVMALVVVARIAITEDADELRGIGGELRVLQPWSPTEASLRPIVYTCQLKDAT